MGHPSPNLPPSAPGGHTSADSFAWSVAIQADGRIVAGGSHGTDFALARYEVDGKLDVTFDGDSGTDNGKVTTNFGGTEGAYSLAIQADGKILLAGFSGDDFAIARYGTDGKLDTTFDGNSGSGNC